MAHRGVGEEMGSGSVTLHMKDNAHKPMNPSLSLGIG